MINFLSLRIAEPNLLQVIILLFIVLAVVYSSIKSYQRNKERTWFFRIILLSLNFLVFIALLGLLFLPSHQSEEPVVIHLDTNNASSRQLNNKHIIYQLKSNKSNNIKNSNIIESPEQILIRHPNIEQLNINGDGLSHTQWKSFSNIPINYQVPKKIVGFTNILWDKKINFGQSFSVEGKVNLENKKVHTILLKDPAGDKINETKVIDNEYFYLTAMPKIEGLHYYFLELLDDKNKSILVEQLALQVLSKNPAKIMILQSSPSFDIKQIQNWAGEQNASLLIDTVISKNKSIIKKVNFPEINDTNFSLSLLEKMDWLFIDGRRLISLEPYRKKQLGQAISNGLGVYILIDEIFVSNRQEWPEWLLQINITPDNEDKEVVPYWSTNNGEFISISETPIVKTNFQFDLKNNKQIIKQVLVRDKNAEPLVFSYASGLGKISLSLLRGTSRWVTNGNQSIYSQFWQNIIYNTARKKSIDLELVDLKNKIFFVNQTAKICVHSIINLNVLTLSHHGKKQTTHELEMLKDKKNSNIFCGYFMPDKSGWYQLKSDQVSFQEDRWIYFYSNHSWLANKQFEKIQATLQQKDIVKKINTKNNQESDNKNFKLINLWFFWWLFVIAVSLIWLERKLNL